MKLTRAEMRNDTGAYYLLLITNDDGRQEEYKYDNAEAARKHARMNQASNPNGLRHLFKMLAFHDTIEVVP
jgi:hypothetical protein